MAQPYGGQPSQPRPSCPEYQRLVGKIMRDNFWDLDPFTIGLNPGLLNFESAFMRSKAPHIKRKQYLLERIIGRMVDDEHLLVVKSTPPMQYRPHPKRSTVDYLITGGEDAWIPHFFNGSMSVPHVEDAMNRIDRFLGHETRPVPIRHIEEPAAKKIKTQVLPSCEEYIDFVHAVVQSGSSVGSTGLIRGEHFYPSAAIMPEAEVNKRADLVKRLMMRMVEDDVLKPATKMGDAFVLHDHCDIRDYKADRGLTDISHWVWTFKSWAVLDKTATRAVENLEKFLYKLTPNEKAMVKIEREDSPEPFTLKSELPVKHQQVNSTTVPIKTEPDTTPVSIRGEPATASVSMRGGHGPNGPNGRGRPLSSTRKRPRAASDVSDNYSSGGSVASRKTPPLTRSKRSTVHNPSTSDPASDQMSADSVIAAEGPTRSNIAIMSREQPLKLTQNLRAELVQLRQSYPDDSFEVISIGATSEVIALVNCYDCGSVLIRCHSKRLGFYSLETHLRSGNHRSKVVFRLKARGRIPQDTGATKPRFISNQPRRASQRAQTPSEPPVVDEPAPRIDMTFHQRAHASRKSSETSLHSPEPISQPARTSTTAPPLAMAESIRARASRELSDPPGGLHKKVSQTAALSRAAPAVTERAPRYGTAALLFSTIPPNFSQSSYEHRESTTNQQDISRRATQMNEIVLHNLPPEPARTSGRSGNRDSGNSNASPSRLSSPSPAMRASEEVDTIRFEMTSRFDKLENSDRTQNSRLDRHEASLNKMIGDHVKTKEQVEQLKTGHGSRLEVADNQIRANNQSIQALLHVNTQHQNRLVESKTQGENTGSRVAALETSRNSDLAAIAAVEQSHRLLNDTLKALEQETSNTASRGSDTSTETAELYNAMVKSGVSALETAREAILEATQKRDEFESRINNLESVRKQNIQAESEYKAALSTRVSQLEAAKPKDPVPEPDTQLESRLNNLELFKIQATESHETLEQAQKVLTDQLTDISHKGLATSLHIDSLITASTTTTTTLASLAGDYTAQEIRITALNKKAKKATEWIDWLKSMIKTQTDIIDNLKLDLGREKAYREGMEQRMEEMCKSNEQNSEALMERIRALERTPVHILAARASNVLEPKMGDASRNGGRVSDVPRTGSRPSDAPRTDARPNDTPKTGASVIDLTEQPRRPSHAPKMSMKSEGGSSGIPRTTSTMSAAPRSSYAAPAECSSTPKSVFKFGSSPRSTHAPPGGGSGTPRKKQRKF